MANPKLVVEVVGDSRNLTRTLKKSETETQLWARKLQGITNTAGVGGGGLLGLGKGGALAAGAGAGLLALKSVIDAASNAQIILGQTSVAVKDAGLSWDKYGAQVQAASLAISKSSAFDDEQVLQSFSVFVRGQKDVEKSLQLSQLAADVARGRYTDLASATQLVNKAALGQIGALRRAGIAIDKNATSTQALAALQAAYGGAAVRYANSAAGAQDRLRVSVENLRESVGSGLLPIISSLVGSLSDGADAAGLLTAKLKGLGVSFDFPTKSGKLLNHTLTDYIEFYPVLKDVLGGTKKAVEDLGAAFDATQNSANQFSTTFGLIAAQGLTPGFAPEAGALPGFTPGNFKIPPAANRKPTGSGVTAEQRNRWFDSDITRRLDKVQDIATIKGQIGALEDIAGLIEQRLAVTKDITRKLSLEDQLRQVHRQEFSLADQARQDAAAAKAAAAAARARLKAAQEQAAATKLQQRTARQFRELGLAPDGSDITPGAANLRKRVASITDRIGGTKLDTPKLHTELARFRKVLAEGLVPKDVRAKIKQMLDDINSELNANAKSGGPLTKTTQLNSDRILAGLGLGADAERTLRARLSHFNSAGRALSGSGSGSRSIVVQPPDVNLDGRKISQNTSKHQARKRNAGSVPRNGPNAGIVIN